VVEATTDASSVTNFAVVAFTDADGDGEAAAIGVGSAGPLFCWFNRLIVVCCLLLFHLLLQTFHRVGERFDLLAQIVHF
jgi:hypothetical protein